MQFEQNKQFLSERELSGLIGVTVSKLQQDRWKCRGLPYCKLGKSVLYSWEDVQAWMNANKIEHEA